MRMRKRSGIAVSDGIVLRWISVSERTSPARIEHDIAARCAALRVDVERGAVGRMGHWSVRVGIAVGVLG